MQLPSWKRSHIPRTYMTATPAGKWGRGRVAAGGEEECGSRGQWLAAPAAETSRRKHAANEPGDEDMVWMGLRDTS